MKGILIKSIIFLIIFANLFGTEEKKETNIPPSSFIKIIKSIENYKPVEESKNYNYKNNIYKIHNDIYMNESENKLWKFRLNRREHIEINNIEVWSVMLKKIDAKDSGMLSDFKITEFTFGSEEELLKSIDKIELVSKRMWNFPKHVNYVYKTKKKVYLFQTRAGMFHYDLLKVCNFFKEKYIK